MCFDKMALVRDAPGKEGRARCLIIEGELTGINDTGDPKWYVSRVARWQIRGELFVATRVGCQ